LIFSSIISYSSWHEDRIAEIEEVSFFKAALRRAFYACVYCMQLRFQRTYVGSNQGNYFENATAFSKRMRKTTVATKLKSDILHLTIDNNLCKEGLSSENTQRHTHSHALSPTHTHTL